MSAIGLEQTITEEFQGLRGLQMAVGLQITQVLKEYERVKDMVVDEGQDDCGTVLTELQNFDEERHAAVDALSDFYGKTAVAVRI